MHATFQSSLWQIMIPSSWRVKKFEECVEINQHEGVGSVHISGALRQVGTTSDSEVRAHLERNCPDGTEIEPANFGDFTGYGAEYVDWNESIFWRRWFIDSGRVLLFITYNCKSGEEELELSQVGEILSSLQLRR